MKCLITGDEGFIGTHLKRFIKDYVPYDKKSGFNILDIEKLRQRMKGCDVVIHLAAKISGRESLVKLADYYSNNIQGTSNVIKVAIECGIKRIVFASSAATYEPFANPYATSKWVNEQMLIIVKNEIKSSTLKFFNVFGRGAYKDAVIPIFIRNIREEKPLTIYGDGNQTRDFIHVDDICRTIVNATQEKGMTYYDVGTTKVYTINELAYILMELIEKTVEIKYVQGRQEIKYSQAKYATFHKSIKVKTNLINGLKEILKNGKA